MTVAGNQSWRPFRVALGHACIGVVGHDRPLWDSDRPGTLISESELTLTGVVIPCQLWHVTDGVRMQYSELGQFHVSRDGSHIAFWFEQLCCQYADKVVERVLSTVVSVALQTRGAVCLHASSVVVDGGALAFMGDSGVGKSTVATRFLASGADVIADDITPVAFSSGQPVALPFAPSLKLMPDIAEVWLEETELTGTYSMVFEKHIIAASKFGSRQAEDASPLRGLFVLNREDSDVPASVRLEPLTGHRRASTLLAHSYLGTIIPSLGLGPAWMDQIDALARTVPIVTLHYGNGLEALVEAQRAIFEWLAQD